MDEAGGWGWLYTQVRRMLLHVDLEHEQFLLNVEKIFTVHASQYTSPSGKASVHQLSTTTAVHRSKSARTIGRDSEGIREGKEAESVRTGARRRDLWRKGAQEPGREGRRRDSLDGPDGPRGRGRTEEKEPGCRRRIGRDSA
eukprot:3422922-Rhodomonas_salina.1